MHTEFCMPERTRKTILRARKPVHTNIKFVEPCLIQGDKMVVCYYHVTYAFQSESALYSCLNVKKLLARNRHEI